MSDRLVTEQELGGLLLRLQALEKWRGALKIEVPATLGARYKTATAQSFTSGAAPAVVNYNTLDYDTHSRVTTGAAWRFTANEDGKYVVDAALLFSSTTGWIDTEAGALSVHKNNDGTAVAFLDRKDSYGSVSSVFMRLGGITTIALSSGDFIDVRASQNSGGALTLFADAAFNYIDIWRM